MTDDPVRDFEAYDSEKEARLSRKPVCSVCGEHICDDSALLLWDEYVCKQCITRNMVWVDEYDEADEMRWEE